MENKREFTIALAGNPNVGKSTIFNALTGMKQHTGNWTGKTVSNAIGYCKSKEFTYNMVDVPGTYSLIASSVEEEVARNYICFGGSDAIIVVCDATCLERNLNLVLQIIEVSPNTIVCINLLDEAKRKGININLDRLSEKLGVRVVGTVAKKKKTLDQLKEAIDRQMMQKNPTSLKTTYPKNLETAINIIESAIAENLEKKVNARWLALRILDGDESLINEINYLYGKNILIDGGIANSISEAEKFLTDDGISRENVKEIITSTLIKHAEKLSKETIEYGDSKYRTLDQKIDKVLTSKRFGYPIMLILLGFILWLTIFAANYPSALLSAFFNNLEIKLSILLNIIQTPKWLCSLIIDGVFKVLTWVIAVMLPPMVIFFPLFTLLEDLGYLPRIAYNLDKPFMRCHACGKQALTMCMGFGCNAVGVVGCRIIDSPRERLIAILTNSFVPCNGKFPTLITLITIFFVASNSGILNSLLSAFILMAVIILGILATFISSKILSKTFLKGVASSFTLELPPYRKPDVGKIIIRSVFDRSLFVLGRAISIAAPTGLIIWIFSNLYIGNLSIFARMSELLDPFARAIGLDGVILLAFILGFPANEIVLPLIFMGYLANGTLTEINSVSEIKILFAENGWTTVTAICMIIFSLFHWPCSTTVLTIKKETGSLKWTTVAILLPTIIGCILCFIVTSLAKII